MPFDSYSVAVKSLCEFTARSGDLSHRFTPSPTAQQGIAGHGIVTRRRGPSYEREVSLEGTFKALRVRGRADGFDAARGRLEEIKTHRGAIDALPANQRSLHWAQLRMYGALLCRQRALPGLELALVYFDIGTEQESVFTEHCMAADLQAFFECHCESFLGWAQRELVQRGERDRYLDAVSFPHGELRRGQRQMAESIYRAALAGRSLLIQAPTGIGKTLGTLFPLLKAMAAGTLDKIFYLVAKTPGRQLAVDALDGLGSSAGVKPLRVLELVSKHDACEFPGRACDAGCPLAKGFYDRLPGARRASVDAAALSARAVRSIAALHVVCPYYLTQELARWCDVIVGDYNYFFDTSAFLHGLAAQNQWRVGLAVDEAHNLVSRARDMYSATLDPQALAAALPHASPRARTQLRGLQRAWKRLSDDRREPYFVLEEFPRSLHGLLLRVVAAIADDMIAMPPAPDGPLLRFYFDALQFARLADAFGTHSLFDVTDTKAGTDICIRNVSPAPFLAPRFAACTTAVLISATLSPGSYYRRVLGMPASAAWLEVDSPFNAEQLEVRIARRISTRYRDRQRSLVPIADLLARQYAARPGNYLAFFASFDYLQAVLRAVGDRYPYIATWEQRPAMSPTARQEFLAQFTATGCGIGFAVLGGIFAEGIDLPGERLVGAFIATLGLPPVNGINAEMERRMQSLFNAGYDYAYLYPGLQKVVQAAGRVIRTEADRGTVHLIDDRYMQKTVRDLLPRWWHVTCS